MKYLMLVCVDESAEAVPEGCDGWSERMEQRGVLRDGAILRPAKEATTIRVREGKVRLSDGPFAETKEHIGGFNLIECADLDEAIKIASEHPVARYGSIEIRPLLEA